MKKIILGDFEIQDYGHYETNKNPKRIVKKICKKCGKISLINYIPKKEKCVCNASNCGENFYINHIGLKVGDMTIIDYESKSKDFIVKCNCCGRIKKARIGNLLDEKQETRTHKNCILNIGIKNKKQNILYLKFQQTWADIIKRVNSDKPELAKYYKNKNITICERWKLFINFYDDLYSDFLKHYEMVGLEKNTTIDRIDSNKNYEQNNIRWATSKLQSLNATSKKNKGKIYIIKNKEEIVLEESISEFCRKNPEYNEESIYLYIKNNKTFYKDIYITKI